MAYIRPYQPSAKYLKEEKERIDLISSSETLMTWTVIINPAPPRWIFAILSSFIFLIAIPLSYNQDKETFTNVSITSIVLFLIFLTYVRYLIFSDKIKTFLVTKNGVISATKQMIPDSAYKIVRSLGWILILASIILIFIIGPVALVGAGGGALLAFSLTNFKPQISTESLLFDKNGMSLTIRNINSISFKSTNDKKTPSTYIDIPEKYFDQFILIVSNNTDNFTFKNIYKEKHIKPETNIIKEI